MKKYEVFVTVRYIIVASATDKKMAKRITMSKLNVYPLKTLATSHCSAPPVIKVKKIKLFE